MQLIEALPSSSTPADGESGGGVGQKDYENPLFENKNGRGMKFFRDSWRTERPTYWEITRVRPAQHGKRMQVWGRLTVNGFTYRKIQKIRKVTTKRGWRFIPEPHLPIMAHFAKHPTDYARVHHVMIVPQLDVHLRNGVPTTDAEKAAVAEAEAEAEAAAAAEAEAENAVDEDVDDDDSKVETNEFGAAVDSQPDDNDGEENGEDAAAAEAK